MKYVDFFFCTFLYSLGGVKGVRELRFFKFLSLNVLLIVVFV